MDSLIYLKITFQLDSFPAYHFYYILNKEQLHKYDVILNGSFIIDFGFYDSDQIDNSMIDHSLITDLDEIKAIDMFLQHFNNSFDILEYIYNKINDNGNEICKPFKNYKNKYDSNTDSDDDLEYTEAKNNFEDIMTETENITDILDISLKDAIMEKDIDIIKQTIDNNQTLIIKDDDVAYSVINMLSIYDHNYCRKLLDNIEELYGIDIITKIINNDYNEDDNNDIPILYKIIIYMCKNKSNIDNEFMIYLYKYTNMDKTNQNNNMTLKTFLLEIQVQYLDKEYEYDIGKIISFLRMIE